MLAAMSVEGATSGAVFHACLERVLLPELRRTKPDAVLVMDDLAAHKTPAVRELLDGSGFPYRYLPSYSPDPSPIEPAWAQVKAELRRVAARTPEELHRALGPALDRVSAANAAAYFRHRGYDHPANLRFALAPPHPPRRYATRSSRSSPSMNRAASRMIAAIRPSGSLSSVR